MKLSHQNRIVADPIAASGKDHISVTLPSALYEPKRLNSAGLDVSDPDVMVEFLMQRSAAKIHSPASVGSPHIVINPASGVPIGNINFMTAEDAIKVVEDMTTWEASPKERADVLRRAADLYEAHGPELSNYLVQEAGKTILDCISEQREAIDFLRYYAQEIERNSRAP